MSTSEAPKAAPKAPKAPNPAFAAMGTSTDLSPTQPANPATPGLPNIRAKLPSRNWTIFLTITGSWAAAVYYDRHQVKLIKQKYIDLVSHLADEPLSPTSLPRKITVFLAAPPGDSITPAREHFRDYVKPVLNAAAVDFDVVEGRQMGELTRKIADGIRRERRGEGLPEGKEAVIEAVRESIGLKREGDTGAVVVGRHAWKEYVRGTHEGWLGPQDDPVPTPKEPIAPAVDASTSDAPTDDSTAPTIDKEDPTTTEDENDTPTPEFPSLILPEHYAAAALPAKIPAYFPPVAPVHFSHLLGFLSTPIRMYRFINRRQVAEVCYREAAAVALGVSRPFYTLPQPEGVMVAAEDVRRGLEGGDVAELEAALKGEERDWPSKVWKEDRYVGVWREGVKGDSRITGRLRRFCLDSGAEVMVDQARE